MRTFYFFTLLSLVIFGDAMAQSHEENTITVNEPALSSKGWQNLFDGKNIDDWAFVGLGDFALEDGMLKSRGKMGVLWYKKQKFGNCVVRAVYKVSDPQTSSAVFVLIPHPPTDVWDVVNHAHQIKILDGNDEYHRTGSVYSFSKANTGLTKPIGQWNTLDIFLKGQHITTYINGKLASDYDPSQTPPARQASSDPERGPRPEIGYVGIQNHNDLMAEVIGQIWFKQISVHPLP
ncbi:MAG: hypothetical protein K0S08_958 [Gammaproteobacteria bacterium]|jgi:hypothetical protein|nr:hypothetical protein [Gammaproteobacteria bacterium]